MTGSDCTVIGNLINTHTHTHTYTHIREFTSRLCGPGGTQWATGGTFWAGFGGIDRAPPARDSNGPVSMAERESRARSESETAGDETTSGGKVRLGDNPSRQLGSLQRGPGYESRRVFRFLPDLR